MLPFLCFVHNLAGVVKLVDAEDSKSSGPCALGGSIPPSGTMENVERLRGLGETRPLFSFRANLPV